MSIIRYTSLSLSEVIEESNLILQVQSLNSYTEEMHISNKPDHADSPPFIKKGLVFLVKDILKNSSGISLPETIKVPDENWRRSLSQHKAQHNEGPSKSFQVKKYDTDVTSIKKASILFLYHFQGMFDLAAKNAFESASAREKIDMLLAS